MDINKVVPKNITWSEVKLSFSSTSYHTNYFDVFSHFICLPFGLSSEKPGSIRLIGTLSLLCTCELGNQPHFPLHSPSDQPFGDTCKNKLLVNQDSRTLMVALIVFQELTMSCKFLGHFLVGVHPLTMCIWCNLVLFAYFLRLHIPRAMFVSLFMISTTLH